MDKGTEISKGLIRDYFAGQALIHLKPVNTIDYRMDDCGVVASMAYNIADAMMAEREKRNADQD
jgi:hypothetical protein